MPDREKVAEAKRKYYLRNKEACIQRSKAQRETQRYKEIQPIRSRASMLRKRYGLSMDDYERMLVAQDRRCAICKTDSPARRVRRYFSVDHCHVTKKVRGLLCHRCNILVSHAENALFPEALKYIQRHIEHDKRGYS